LGIYSAEKFNNGSVIIFGHYSFGVVPLIVFGTQDDLNEFIILLQSAQDKTKVPEAFMKAFND